MKKEVVKLLKKALKEEKIKLKDKEIEDFLEIPPKHDMGDYSFPCFFLAEKLKREPHQIALEIRAKIGTTPIAKFDDIQVTGAYINFFLDRKDIARQVVWDVITKKEKYGLGTIGKGKKVIVEFSSPNIAKPFGIGHLRSTIIGNSLANIYAFQGYKTIKMNYFGDWGTQFGKLLYGYEKFGNEKKLRKDPLKHLYDIYVKMGKSKKYDDGARIAFNKLEKRDKKSLMLWKLFKGYSIKEFEKIYKKLGITFDKYVSESDYNRLMKNTIKELTEKKLLVKSEGAMIVDLKKDNLGVCLIKKSDGSTLYATRDITSAISRYKKHKFDKMIYEVGQEQKLYFQQFLKVLDLMGYKWSTNCEHIYHGLYLDTDGKKFSTRKGKTVFMNDILNKTISLAKKGIQKRTKKISKPELERRALKIAIAAIFYGDLKNNRVNDAVFDVNKFVSFEGDTGPYIQYSYARATSILNKSKNKDKFNVPDLTPIELKLSKKISQFPGITYNACKTNNPALIANYSYQLSQLFNEFYHACPVLGSDEESFRLALIESFRQTLKNALKLLGMDVLEKM